MTFKLYHLRVPEQNPTTSGFRIRYKGIANTRSDYNRADSTTHEQAPKKKTKKRCMQKMNPTVGSEMGFAQYSNCYGTTNCIRSCNKTERRISSET